MNTRNIAVTEKKASGSIAHAAAVLTCLNPKTGEEVPILPRRVLVFRASHVLKDRINQGLNSQKGAA